MKNTAQTNLFKTYWIVLIGVVEKVTLTDGKEYRSLTSEGTKVYYKSMFTSLFSKLDKGRFSYRSLSEEQHYFLTVHILFFLAYIGF